MYYYDDHKTKTNGEFDVVTLSRDGYDFYEVKYTEKPVSDVVIREEEFQQQRGNIEYNRMGFFSKSGFEIEDESKYILYSLEDVYSWCKCFRNPERSFDEKIKVDKV